MRILPLKIQTRDQAKEIFKKIGVSKEAFRILSDKIIPLAFKIDGIRSWEANIIKQHLLSLGSDAALNRDILIKDTKTSIVIFGSIGQLKKLVKKLKPQPFSLKEISQKLNEALNNYFKKNYVLLAHNKKIIIKKPIICGIINITSDSFSGDGFLKLSSNPHQIKKLVLKKAENMLQCGVKIIDIGGESSRPYAKPISAEEEIKRVVPIIKCIRRHFKDIVLSVDTYKYPVAKAAADAGIDIINDIYGLRDKKIISLIARYKLGCVLMHMKGTPATMQINPYYDDVIAEINDFFRERISYLLKQGIKKQQIVIDPGIGFGKRLKDNLCIIRNLYQFKLHSLPILIGLSRKSFIGKILTQRVENRLIGSLAAASFAITRGANILRVHDVEETRQMVKITTAICN